MNFPPLPRRRFLQAAALAGGALAFATPLPSLAMAPTRYATPAGTLLVLDAERVVVLTAFAEATIATGNGFPPVTETSLVRRIDEELFFTEPAIRADVLLAIDAIDLLPLAYGRFSRLHRMPASTRRQFLDDQADTRFETVRAMINGLRMVTCLTYYADRATWAAMGYGGTHAGLRPLEGEQRAYYREQTASSRQRGNDRKDATR